MRFDADPFSNGLDKIDQQMNVSPGFVHPHHFAVAGDHRFEIQLIEPSKRRTKILRIAAEHVRDRMDDEVTGHEDLFFRKKNDGVAGGVPATEMHDPHLAIPEVDAHFRIEREIRRAIDDRFELFLDRSYSRDRVLIFLSLAFGKDFSIPIFSRFKDLLQTIAAFRKPLEPARVVTRALSSGFDVGNDVQAGKSLPVRAISHRMIEMPVSVHEIANRLAGPTAYLSDILAGG